MYCKCTVTDNYQVIGLCNLRKYGCITTQEPWTEISAPDILVLPTDKPDIETINKIYNKVEITSTYIINTPCANEPSTEGLQLTGKKLIIEGYICQNVIYTAAIDCQSVHPVNFRIPFCTYVIIDGDADIDLDQYCVLPCLEDVYAQVLSPRMIFMNATMFLLAKKINKGC